MLRRLVVFVVVAAATAGGSTWWLYEGDLARAVEPVLPEWDADALAIRSGLADPGLPVAPPAPPDPAEPDAE